MKIRIVFAFLVLINFAKLYAQSQDNAQTDQEVYKVYDLELEGAEFTDRDWVIEYLELKFPAILSSENLRSFTKKLLTTAVFTNVTVTVKQISADGKMNLLIDLDEKWTLVPVFRAAFGGGTPLTVFGAYDTHSFGRLWTIGTEFRKYGDADPGYVIWAKAPRWKTGKHLFGIELWQDYRIRTLYNENDEPTGHYKFSAQRVRLQLLSPLEIFSFSKSLQFGFDLQYSIEAPYRFKIEEQKSLPDSSLLIEDSEKKQSSAVLLGKLVYDTIQIDNLFHDGFRSILNFGPNLMQNETNGFKIESENFLYLLWGESNLAAHLFLGKSGGNRLSSQYFLGGLESIRGVPDGAVWGNHAAYFNLEFRHLAYRAKYLWTQPIVFLDSGMASNTADFNAMNGRSSAGFGFRFAIPQIYRMVFRFDYAWCIDGSGARGISLGMNDLFQPYPPL